MRLIDFSTWQGIATSILGLAVFALIGVGIRVLVLQTLQKRQQRMNRQINERLKTLISAYRTLGGSFTGQLTVSPAHLRDAAAADDSDLADSAADGFAERPRRIRDAVEAALADVILLGTDEHVRLAGQAAGELAAGRPIHTAELVISLRTYIRLALDLEPIPDDVTIPLQGPTRPQPAFGRRSGADGNRDSTGSGQGGGGAGGGAALGMGLGLGVGGDAGSDLGAGR